MRSEPSCRLNSTQVRRDVLLLPWIFYLEVSNLKVDSQDANAVDQESLPAWNVQQGISEVNGFVLWAFREPDSYRDRVFRERNLDSALSRPAHCF